MRNLGHEVGNIRGFVNVEGGETVLEVINYSIGNLAQIFFPDISDFGFVDIFFGIVTDLFEPSTFVSSPSNFGVFGELDFIPSISVSAFGTI